MTPHRHSCIISSLMRIFIARGLSFGTDLSRLQGRLLGNVDARRLGCRMTAPGHTCCNPAEPAGMNCVGLFLPRPDDRLEVALCSTHCTWGAAEKSTTRALYTIMSKDEQWPSSIEKAQERQTGKTKVPIILDRRCIYYRPINPWVMCNLSPETAYVRKSGCGLLRTGSLS